MQNDYKEGDIIVSLKGNIGVISIATWFECKHIPGNYRKVTPEDKLYMPIPQTDTISKKLIAVVLNLITTPEFQYEIQDNQLLVSDYGEQLFEMSIYEFAQKCKLWAVTQNVHIYSKSTSYKGVAKIRKRLNGNKRKSLIHCEIKPTESEAIIAVCEWMLSDVK